MKSASPTVSLGWPALAAGELRRAALLLGTVNALVECTQHQLDPIDRSDAEQIFALTRPQLDPAAFATAHGEGRAMNLEQAVAYALGA